MGPRGSLSKPKKVENPLLTFTKHLVCNYVYTENAETGPKRKSSQ